MFSDARQRQAGGDPTALTLEDLLAVKPAHVRGRLKPGARGPEGERPGRGRAQSLDFDGLTPYAPGDDVRWIDWRASLRSGETMARRYAAASHRAHMVVLELSPELHFGTAGQIMARTAALTTGWLVWRALALSEPVGLMVNGTAQPPRRGRRHALRLLEAVVAGFGESARRAQPIADLEAAAAMIGRQDELCVVGEMPVPPDAMIAAGRALSASRELIFCLVEDPIMAAPVPPGRYPVRAPDGSRHQPQVGAKGGPDRHETPRAERMLSEAGWRIQRALDVLPRVAP